MTPWLASGVTTRLGQWLGFLGSKPVSVRFQKSCGIVAMFVNLLCSTLYQGFVQRICNQAQRFQRGTLCMFRIVAESKAESLFHAKLYIHIYFCDVLYFQYWNSTHLVKGFGLLLFQEHNSASILRPKGLLSRDHGAWEQICRRQIWLRKVCRFLEDDSSSLEQTPNWAKPVKKFLVASTAKTSTRKDREKGYKSKMTLSAITHKSPEAVEVAVFGRSEAQKRLAKSCTALGIT